MVWQFVPKLIQLGIVVVLVLAVAVTVWQRRPAKGATAFAGANVAVAIWAIGYFLNLARTDLPGKVLGDDIGFIGSALAPTLWLAFVLQYTGREAWLTRRTLILLAVEPSTTIILAFTNNLHHLVRTNVHLETSAQIPYLAFEYGTWGQIDAVYGATIALFATFMLFRSLVRSPHLYRGQAWALILGSLAPAITSALFFSGITGTYELDLTPFGFAFTSLVIGVALFRYRLLDLVPIARSALIENMREGVIVLDAQSRIVDVNPAARAILDGNRKEFIGISAAQVLQDRPDLVEAFLSSQEAQVEISHGPAEASRTFEISNSPLQNRNGLLTGRLVVMRDVTQRLSTEKALQEANWHLRGQVDKLRQRNQEITLLSEMADLFQTCLTPEETYTAIELSVRQLFPGQSGAVFVVSSSRDLAEAVARWGENLVGKEAFVPNECWALRRGRAHSYEGVEAQLPCPHVGETGLAHMCVPMMAQGETLGMFHVQSNPATTPPHRADEEETPFQRQLALTVADQIALAISNMNLRETLRNQAIRDPLTGLFNRRYIEETLEREIHRADRQHTRVAVILLDIDHFKQFNDAFGHEAGDLLLQSVGRLLRTNTRGEDIACRLGGDEFFVVMPDAPMSVALARAESLRESVRSLKIQHQYQTLKGVTISAGIASFPEHGRTGKTVMRAADTALYQAKAEGRDRAALAAEIAPA